MATTPVTNRNPITRQPATTVLAVLVVLAHLVRWHVPGLYVASTAGMLLAVAATIALGFHVERRIGWWRTVVVVVSSVVAAIFLGAGIVWAATAIGGWFGWTHGSGVSLFDHGMLGALPWLCGLLLAGTTTMSALWRRRLRLAVVVTVLSAVLYLGHRANVEVAVGALTGLAVGALLCPARTSGPRHRHGVSLRERRTLVAVLVVATAVGPVFARLLPGADGLLSPIGDLLGHQTFSPEVVARMCLADPESRRCLDAMTRVRHSGAGPVILGLLPTIFGLVAAYGLRRGRRAAWFGAIGVFSVWLVFALVQLVMYQVTAGGYFGNPLWLATSTLPLIGVLYALIISRHAFALRTRPGTGRRAGIAAAVTLVGGWIAYVVAGLATASGFATRPTVISLLVDYPRRLIPPRFLGTMEIHSALAEQEDVFATSPLPMSPAATVVYEWTGIVVWIVLAIILWTVLRAALASTVPEGSAVIKELLHAPGGGNLSWMTTWPGNQYWIASDRGAAVAYRPINGVYLTVGDPIADEAHRGDAALRFVDHALSRGAVPCLYSVDQATRDACVAIGMHSVQVAEETVIPLPDLEFRGKKFQDVRTAINRARKEEITTVWTTWAAAPLGIRDQITAISEAWVSDKGLPEMGLTLGGLDELEDPEVRLLLAVDARGTVHGVTSWMPVFRDGTPVGLTLDFMRRRSSGFRPVMEFLIAAAALDAKEEGLEFLSLSGAPLAHSRGADDEDTSVLDGILNRVGEAMEPVYGFRSLLAFKAKFQPEYRPMYMCYEDPASLPTIGTAVARAYLGPVSPAAGARLVAALGQATRVAAKERRDQRTAAKAERAAQAAAREGGKPDTVGTSD